MPAQGIPVDNPLPMCLPNFKRGTILELRAGVNANNRVYC